MSFLKKLIRKILAPMRKKRRTKGLATYGEHVTVGNHCTFLGHVECGDHVYIGDGAYFVSTRAKLIIGDHVMFGPNVTIYTGDHAVHVIGKYLDSVTDQDKDELVKNGKSNGFDLDVVIEEDCWIGTRAIILKGVTIGRGSVIGAGAIVTKDVPPYSIYVGVPACKTFRRFTDEEIAEHEQLLYGSKIKEV